MNKTKTLEKEIQSLREEVTRLKDEIALLRLQGGNQTHHHYHAPSPPAPLPFTPIQPYYGTPNWIPYESPTCRTNLIVYSGKIW